MKKNEQPKVMEHVMQEAQQWIEEHEGQLKDGEGPGDPGGPSEALVALICLSCRCCCCSVATNAIGSSSSLKFYDMLSLGHLRF